MAVIPRDQMDRFKRTGIVPFFGLKNDRDTAFVRFLYETDDDITPLSVHQITVHDKKRWVDCLRTSPDQPNSVCPLCEAQNNAVLRLFIPLVEIEYDDAGKESGMNSKIWERGINYVTLLEGHSKRYRPLCGCIFEIERDGKKGDTNTRYNLYPTTPDDITLKDLPEAPQILGKLVLELTADEMDEFLQTGRLPNSEDNGDARRPARGDSQPPRRRGAPERNDGPDGPTPRRGAPPSRRGGRGYSSDTEEE